MLITALLEGRDELLSHGLNERADMSFISQFVSGNATSFKSQIFTSSGTFTPSAALLASGGVVAIRMAGGGGGGGGGIPSSALAGFGGSSSYWEGFATVTGNVTVTIGSGGAAGTTSDDFATRTSGSAGGTTSFGSVSVAGGGGGSGANKLSPMTGTPGGFGRRARIYDGFEGFQAYFGPGATGNRYAPTANSGGGGGSVYSGSYNGAAGYVQVFWVE